MLSSSRGHRLVCGGPSGLDGPQRTAQFNDSNTTDGVACQLEHMKQPSLYGYHTRLANCTPIFKYQRQQDLWSSMQPTVMIETPKASTNHRWFFSIVVYSHLDGWAYWRADKPYYISLEYVVKWSEPRYDWLGIVRLSPPDLAYTPSQIRSETRGRWLIFYDRNYITFSVVSWRLIELSLGTFHVRCPSNGLSIFVTPPEWTGTS